MTNLNRKISAVGWISFLTLLERFVYYGFRSIIVLYFILPEGYGWEYSEALGVYGKMTMAFGLAVLPMGVIADKLLGLKRSLWMGAAITALGFTLFFISDRLFLAAIILAVMGTGLFRPSSIVLLGRVFPVQSVGRDYGFLVFYLAINIGAAISSLAVGSLAENVSFKWGFGLVALVAVLMALLSFVAQQEIIEEEQKVSFTPMPVRLGNIFLIIALGSLFWGFYEMSGSHFYDAAAQQGTVTIFNQTLRASLLMNMSMGLLFPALAFMALAWYLLRWRSSWTKVAMAFVLAGGAYLLFDIYDVGENPSSYLSQTLQVSLLLAFAEVCIAPIAYSILTRSAPLGWGATVIGLFYAVSYGANKLFAEISMAEWAPKNLMWLAISCLFLALVVLAWYLLIRFGAKSKVN